MATTNTSIGVAVVLDKDTSPSRPQPPQWWRRLWHSERATRGRYSLAQARRLLTLLVAFALPLIPFQDPRLGALSNWGIFTNHYFLNWVCMDSGMIQARAATAIDHNDYSLFTIMFLATFAAAGAVGFFILTSIAWRFPVPFYGACAGVTYVLSLMAAHFLLAHAGRLPWSVCSQLRQYAPSLMIQVSQLALYPIYSSVFMAADEWQQVVLVLLFPCIKYVLRKWIYAVSRHLGDHAKEMAVCGVEISASLYQATIMQTTPSPLVSALIIGIDVALSVFEIKHYLDRRSIVPTSELLARAARIIEDSKLRVNDHELVRFGTRTRTFFTTVSVTPTSMTSVDRDKLIVAQALEILQSAESILFVEYLEVAIPLLNACLLLVASPLPSSTCHRILRPFHDDPTMLGPAVASILLYTSLQALTLIGMGVAMRIRYGLSATKLLAFALEAHRWSVQGKLLLWLTVTFAIPIVHYGIDFTFTFDFAIPDGKPR